MLLNRKNLIYAAIHSSNIGRLLLYSLVLTPEHYIEYVSLVSLVFVFQGISGFGYIEYISREYILTKNIIVSPSVLSTIVFLSALGFFVLSAHVFELGYVVLLYALLLALYNYTLRIIRLVLNTTKLYMIILAKVCIELLLLLLFYLTWSHITTTHVLWFELLSIILIVVYSLRSIIKARPNYTFQNGFGIVRKSSWYYLNSIYF